MALRVLLILSDRTNERRWLHVFTKKKGVNRNHITPPVSCGDLRSRMVTRHLYSARRLLNGFHTRPFCRGTTTTRRTVSAASTDPKCSTLVITGHVRLGGNNGHHRQTRRDQNRIRRLVLRSRSLHRLNVDHETDENERNKNWGIGWDPLTRGLESVAVPDSFSSFYPSLT